MKQWVTTNPTLIEDSSFSAGMFFENACTLIKPLGLACVTTFTVREIHECAKVGESSVTAESNDCRGATFRSDALTRSYRNALVR